MRGFRRLLALALVAGLTLMNVQAAELHVHDGAAPAADAHQHGPASHHHEVDRHWSEGTRVAALDADDTVVHVALVAASAKSIKPLHAEEQVAALPDWSVPASVAGARIVARAHGPPSIVQHSLRAPPTFLSL